MKSITRQTCYKIVGYQKKKPQLTTKIDNNREIKEQKHVKHTENS